MAIFSRVSFVLAVTAFALVTGTLVACAGFGLRYNSTSSMPQGFYRITNTSVSRGAYVTVCLPADNPFVPLMRNRLYEHNGSCASGLTPLIKPVAAVAGDSITLTEHAVYVNGAALGGSPTLARDGEGRPLPSWPRGTYRVAQGTVWLVSTYSRRSLDSRYFGPVPVAAIQHVMQKL
jgi:conjugative transfer signal peptidase TraF